MYLVAPNTRYVILLPDLFEAIASDKLYFDICRTVEWKMYSGRASIMHFENSVEYGLVRLHFMMGLLGLDLCVRGATDSGTFTSHAQ